MTGQTSDASGFAPVAGSCSLSSALDRRSLKKGFLSTVPVAQQAPNTDANLPQERENHVDEI